MKFRQLEAFSHIMITGSMVSAAAEMNVSQPAVSRLISDLEAHLKFSLFERKQGALIPTPEGTRFFESVEENFLGLGRLEKVAENIRGDTGQVLRVAATHSLAATLLPPVLEKFHQRFPKTKVVIHSHRLSQLIVRLQNSSVDIAIAAQLPNLRGTERILLGNVRQVCALPVGHRLAALKTICASDLAGETILGIMPDGPARWSEVFSQLKSEGVAFKDNYEVDTAHTAYSIIARGLAVGIIEPFGARMWVQSEKVVWRPYVPHIEMQYHYSVMKRRQYRSDQAKFLEYLKAYCGAAPEFDN
ncbi:LysR family transcriptional regulator [Lentibacter sp. XHP0401]|jgi:DNA-binding transcriptional LysR family regulator|uniref:LysR family transcriptional regulator n=1 Tax=Lentibacter sp. XHP0401 TaxID=2984334 RepID=UPI0021E96FEF|nr:LysR family transcriptional regulator [Lentibacter sp. XHP0401]MCV2892628.1 LysR family transcriptional regulator [Lentibacter sp. XHP0401]